MVALAIAAHNDSKHGVTFKGIFIFIERRCPRKHTFIENLKKNEGAKELAICGIQFTTYHGGECA